MSTTHTTPRPFGLAFGCGLAVMGLSASLWPCLGSPLSIMHWGTDEGLGPGPATAILQTKDGFLWFGSEEGLMRFDGVHCTIFDSRNTAALRSHSISTLFEDQRGNLWIGTAGGGVVRRDTHGQLTPFGKAQGLANERVSALTQDADGRLWVGTDGGGLFELGPRDFHTFPANAGLPSPHITALVPDADHGLWIGSKQKLVRIRGGQIDTQFAPEGAVPPESVALLAGQEGRLWVGGGAGLFLLDQGRFERAVLSSDLRGVQSLAAGVDGRLWVGTVRGLVRVDGTNALRVTTDHGLSGNLIQSVYRDHEGSIWVSSDVPGVDQIRATRFAFLSTQHGLSHPIATGIYEDHAGALWIGGHQGLNRYENGATTHWSKRDGLAGNLVFTMCEDPKGGMWIGTYDGLSRFVDGQFKTYTKADGLPHNVIWCLYRDRADQIWAGTHRGLVRIDDPGRFGVYDYDNSGLSHNDVRAICQDAKGRLWIGTSYGLNCLEDGRITKFIEGAKDRPFNVVLALHTDAAGDVWVGTMEHGLFRYRDGRFVNLTVENGLYDNLTFQILEDGLDNFWLTCNRGISRVRKADLNACADGTLATVPYTVFGKPDGLPSTECNGTFQPAGCKARDGRLWFPTSKGVAVVDPDHLPRNPLPPPVQIEEIRLDGTTSSWSDTLRVGPDIDRIEIYYTGLSFVAPTQMRFKYKLVGLDRDWVEGEADRVARYVRVPPGEYRFHVQASNNDGVWNETGASLGLIVLPPWWRSAWFLGALGLTTVGSVGGLARLLTIRKYRRRMVDLEREHALEMERRRIATDLHDDVGSNLGSIALISQSARREADPALADEFAEIQQLAEQTADAMRDIVWFIDDSEDELQRMVLRMKETAARLLSETRWRFQSPEPMPARKLSTEFKRHFFLIYKESLHNIRKHARATQVDIALDMASDHLALSIDDNGTGFLASARPSGLGWNSMHRRASSLGWTLTIVNRRQGGTSVQLKAHF